MWKNKNLVKKYLWLLNDGMRDNVGEAPFKYSGVIDGHSHIGSPPSWMEPEPFMKLLDEAGIARAIVCRFLPGGNTLDSNRYVKDKIMKGQGRLIVASGLILVNRDWKGR